MQNFFVIVLFLLASCQQFRTMGNWDAHLDLGMTANEVVEKCGWPADIQTETSIYGEYKTYIYGFKYDWGVKAYRYIYFKDDRVIRFHN